MAMAWFSPSSPRASSNIYIEQVKQRLMIFKQLDIALVDLTKCPISNHLPGSLTNGQLRDELQKQKELLKKASLELKTEREENEAYRSQTDAARRKFAAVVNDLKQEKDALREKLKKTGDATPASDFRPLNLGIPNVTKFDDNLVSKSSITCSLSAKVHEPPEEVFDAFFVDHTTNATIKMLYQKVIEGTRVKESVVVFWSFMVDQMKSCELTLRLKKVEGSEDEIIIGVESFEEEELETMILPNPHSTAPKKLMLILRKGTIVLRGLQFRQTSFTIEAQVEVGEVGDRKAIEEFKQEEKVDARERRKQAHFMVERWEEEVYSKEENVC
ncbi:hypothetical protein TrLO_g704 [Triparma laevis f. longispina]|uniref:Uncharacterized protein n=1 Tax=Triparma laevis f. longispina TaxID=1714387 RepID=A0A9W7FQW8_9STRA|nr:hypothetical protein TrLO_g704 [Triparma laevis f. longispina]